jgi:hypothetical protein
MHPYCKEEDCKKCFFYRPVFLGFPVPKKLGNFLFSVEDLFFRMERGFFKN